MKIYKNPFVSRECYFVKTGKAYSGRMEAPKSKGYQVQFSNGKWIVREAQFYDSSLRDEFPIVADIKFDKGYGTIKINVPADIADDLTNGSRQYVGGFLLLDRETYERLKGGEEE